VLMWCDRVPVRVVCVGACFFFIYFSGVGGGDERDFWSVKTST
jgi:hypothetical protein